ncbi:MAG: hypothetical protein RLY86_2112, partial [Pseudomonadota bacterium]
MPATAPPAPSADIPLTEAAPTDPTLTHPGARGDTALQREIQAFLDRHPGIVAVDVLLPDLCGVFRGKRVPVDELAKLAGDGVALPGCTFAVDITGETIEETGMSIDRGVPDQVCRPVPRTLAPVPWAARPL